MILAGYTSRVPLAFWASIYPEPNLPFLPIMETGPLYFLLLLCHYYFKRYFYSVIRKPESVISKNPYVFYLKLDLLRELCYAWVHFNCDLLLYHIVYFWYISEDVSLFLINVFILITIFFLPKNSSSHEACWIRI